MLGASRQSLAAVEDRLQQLAAESRADLGEVAEELFSVTTVLDRYSTLRRVLSDPAVPVDRKVGLVDDMFGRRVGELTVQVLRSIAAQHWSAPRDVADTCEVLAVQAAVSRAQASGVLDDVEDQLFRFTRIVDREPALRSALTDARLPDDRKVALLRALLAERADPVTVQLVTHVVVHPRGRPFERAMEETSQLVAARQERLIADVTSAVPLDADQMRRLADALARSVGRDVHLQVRVDPDVIGGLRVRVGDELIDGTVAGYLRELSHQLGDR